MDHVQYLLNHSSKDKHCLTKTTLNPVDRQNFASVMKLCDEKVIKLLKQHVKNSEATVKFLEMMQEVMDAFMNRFLSSEERIKKIWRILFFIRLWRKKVIKAKKLTMKENFLTTNSYSCLELNFHSLLFSIVSLRKQNQSQFCRIILVVRLAKSFTGSFVLSLLFILRLQTAPVKKFQVEEKKFNCKTTYVCQINNSFSPEL